MSRMMALRARRGTDWRLARSLVLPGGLRRGRRCGHRLGGSLALPNTRLRGSVALPWRHQRAGEIETDGQLALASDFGVEKECVGQPLLERHFHLNCLAGSHHAFESYLVHPRGNRHAMVSDVD